MIANMNNGPIGTYNENLSHNHVTNGNPITNNHIYLHPGPNQPEFDDWMQKVGMLLQVPSLYQSLKPYIELLALTLMPERIFLISPTVSDTPEANYAQIVLTFSSENYFEEATRFFCDLLSFRKREVLIYIYPSTFVEEALQNGHPFFSLKCTERHLVFSSSPYRLPHNSDDRLNELKFQIKHYFIDTIEKVIKLIDTAKKLKTDNQHSLSASLLYQSCKALFNAVIGAFGGDHNESNDLIELQQTARLYMPFAVYNISGENVLEAVNKDYFIYGTCHVTDEELNVYIDGINSLLNSIIAEVEKVTEKSGIQKI